MKNFDIKEFDCQETSENRMQPKFLQKIDMLRDACGFPFVITSGYRSPSHSLEREKPKAGTHAQGIAADIMVKDGVQRAQIVESAIALGFNGIGVAKTFVHVDVRKGKRVIWSY